MNGYNIEKLKGKTIKTVEVIRAEDFAENNIFYTCFVCTDGTKLIVKGGTDKPYNPQLDIEEMQKAPNYFSAQDIADRVLYLENQRKTEQKEKLLQKRKQLVRLQKEINSLEWS